MLGYVDVPRADVAQAGLCNGVNGLRIVRVTISDDLEPQEYDREA